MHNYSQFTISISLEKYGIKNSENIIYNPSFELLYNEELNSNLEGFEKGQLSELGAVNVMTGVFTGRSPKDKYIVNEENEFLLLLSLKKKYCSEKDSWVDNNSSQLRITDTNSEHFVLFLSTELFNNPNYTVFYKKLQKEFIDTFHKIGVEVRIIPSSKIEEANYSNNFNMNFNKIDELTNHLNNDVQHLLFNNRNYAVSAGLNVPLEDRNPIFVPEEPVQESDLDWIDEYIGRPTRRRTRPTESGYNIQLIDDTVDTDTLTPF